MRNKIFIAVFCVFILAVMIGSPVKMVLTNAGVLESENVGNVIEVEKYYEEGTFGATLFNGIEEIKRDINDIYINYIPFYVDITSAASSVQLSLNTPITTYLVNTGNKILLDAQNKANESEKPAETTAADEAETTEEIYTEPPFDPIIGAVYLKGDSTHRYYEITAQLEEDSPLIDFYVRIPAKENSYIESVMKKQAEKINDFVARRPDVNWYIFPVTCFEDTVLCDDLLPTESKSSLFNEFFTLIDPSIIYDYIEIESFETKNELFYKTDHHWNAYGFVKGYEIIVDMLKQNYPDITPLEPTIIS